MDLNQLGRMLQQLDARLTRIERSARLSHAAIDNTSVEVRDGSGGLRGLLGVQADGTTAVNIVNGPTPPAPTAPTVEPALAALAITWDGAFAGALAAPLDWLRVEVHVGPDPGFVPAQGTLRGTIESPQGGTVSVPLPYTEWYVKLRSRTQAGVASAATEAVAATPRKADTQDLNAGAVTADTIAVDALTGKTITGGEINGSIITGGFIRTAATGERIAINEQGINAVVVFNAAGTPVGTFDVKGLRMRGSSGALLSLTPEGTYPRLTFYNSDNSNWATAQIIETAVGDANFELFGGKFAGSGYPDMRYRLFMGRDFGVLERTTRQGEASVQIGGRLYINDSQAILQYVNDIDPSQNSSITTYPGYAVLGNARLRVMPPADANSAIYLEVPTAYTGPLLRLARDEDRFTVDKDGNTTVSGVLKAGSITTGRATVAVTVAGQAASTVVSGLTLKGSTVRVTATAASSTVGSVVTGVGVTSQSLTGFTVWANRTSTGNVLVDWIAIAS